MKSNKELRDEFNELVKNFDATKIVELASDYAAQIPYIQMHVLECAFQDYVNHGDDRSIRALVEADFQVFVDPRAYGATGVFEGMDILHTHWSRQTVPSKKITDLMTFIYECQYEHACAVFAAGEENEHNFDDHDLGLLELKALHFDKEAYPKAVIEIENDEAVMKKKLVGILPHIKFRM